MNILFTICGRAGSKGIKNKNIMNFCGYPLVYFTLSVIDLFKSSSDYSDIDVVINSDSEKLVELVKNNPFFKIDIINREADLGKDNIPKIMVIKDSLLQMENKKNKKYDLVIDLDITSPLRTKNDLISIVDVHLKKKADLTTSVVESRRNPYFNMLKKNKKGYSKVLDSNFTTRQQAPEIFDMNASIYCYNPNFLLSNKSVLDGYTECIKMNDTGILDLDSENDFELMQVIGEYLFTHKLEYKEIRNNINQNL